jgi:hypothetical protein
MAKDSDQPASGFEAENTGGVLSGLLAEEDAFDRRSLWWRLGSWGVAAVGAVTIALLANQSSMGLRREQVVVADDLARQTQQIRAVAKEGQNETRRLASAIDTLNGDRDRLYSRVTVIEQGLDSVTGAIARQTAVATPPAAAAAASPATTEPPPASQNPAPAPVVAPAATTAAAMPERPRPAAAEPAPASSIGPTVASAGQAASTAPPPTPATPLMASKSVLAPPDAAAGKLIEPEVPASVVTAAPIPEVVASTSPADNAEADKTPATAPKVAVQRTEFGVDIGGANSLGGLRALWRGLLKSRSNAPLAALRPIIVVKESSNGLGMQLRLVAGPLGDAAAAAKICATLIENDRTCETTVFDGQRLAIKAEDPPAAVKPVSRRRGVARRAAVSEEPPKKPVTSTISSIFSKRGTTQ